MSREIIESNLRKLLGHKEGELGAVLRKDIFGKRDWKQPTRGITLVNCYYNWFNGEFQYVGIYRNINQKEIEEFAQGMIEVHSQDETFSLKFIADRDSEKIATNEAAKNIAKSLIEYSEIKRTLKPVIEGLF